MTTKAHQPTATQKSATPTWAMSGSSAAAGRPPGRDCTGDGQTGRPAYGFAGTAYVVCCGTGTVNCSSGPCAPAHPGVSLMATKYSCRQSHRGVRGGPRG